MPSWIKWTLIGAAFLRALERARAAVEAASPADPEVEAGDAS